MTHNRQDISALFERHGLRASRALGQNFVADANTVRRIAKFAQVGNDELVVEVGAGLGSLTLALAETGARIKAIEVDRYLLPALRDVTSDIPNIDVIEGNALELDWDSLIPEGQTATLVANLPYNVGTLIVADRLDFSPRITRMVVMVQKEVAQRLVADVGSNAYGALSVKVRYHAIPKMLGYVPPSVFVPKPDVDSAIVELVRRPSPPVDVAPESLFPLVKAGFAQRRKMLRRALSHVVTPEMFAAAEIDPTARAEELDVLAWGRLAQCRMELASENNSPSQS